MLDLRLATSHKSDCHFHVKRGSLRELGARLHELLPAPRKAVVLTDRNVAPFHLEAAEQSLASSGFGTHAILVPPGEESKSLKTLGNVWDRMLAFGVERESVLVALGGGVVGDLGGFAAATLLRGMAHVQLPTSLVGQVDSAIGGKNGLNRPLGKNLAGTFHQPRLVLIDPDLLATLPEREFRSGLAEVIKYGFLRDAEILEKLRALGDLETLRAGPEAIDELVERCVQIKVDFVKKDEREGGERTLLNFGHTTGHALEAADEYRNLLHGEAVAIGMVAAAFLAVDLGFAPATLPAEISELLERYGLPLSTALSPERILPWLGVDKKRRAGKDRWVLVARPGEARIVEEPPIAHVRRALEAIHVRPADGEKSDDAAA
jgi:3-dehydroquinate synthase